MLRLSSTLLILLSLFFSAVATAQDFEQLNQSIRDIYKRVDPSNKVEEFDFTDMEKHIAVLNNALGSNTFSLPNQLIIRRARVYAIDRLNFERSWDELPVDISQVELAIIDVDFIVEKFPESNLKRLEYLAGHMAMHLLESPTLAFQYWTTCANRGHAGCMNIVGTHRFTGENGFAVDMDEAIRWHKNVFSTGTQFTCAGVFSAVMLLDISYYFPKAKTGGSWQDWVSAVDKLTGEVMQKLEEDDVCHQEFTLLNIYVKQLSVNKPDSLLLDNAIHFAEDESFIALLKLLKSGGRLSSAPSLLNDMKHPHQRCSAAFNTTRWAKITGNASDVNLMQDYLTTLDSDECSWSNAIMHKLQTAGRW